MVHKNDRSWPMNIINSLQNLVWRSSNDFIIVDIIESMQKYTSQ
mgnify:CR=1 FL=1